MYYMKITLDCSKAEFVRMIKDSPTFSELFEIESLGSNLDSLLAQLKPLSNKIDQIKFVRNIKDEDVLRRIEVYCGSNNIHFDRYNNEIISLATAKNFVEHFVK